MEHNVKRSNDGQLPELFVTKLRTEFARPTGPTSSGSVLVLLKSTYVPTTHETIPQNLDLEAIDELSLINSFDEQAANRPCRTWWLTFVPQPGPEDGWSFDHAETENSSGRRTQASDTAWIAALMPMRREKPKMGAARFVEFEVDSNPIWRNAYFGVDRFPDIWIKVA
ncbi:MAG TPA: hypothetical protein VK832_11635, partial [Burkholderiaceae bacterium]|nr:hypothetical protein [Burkholderiaceae bacterium]